MYIGTMFVYKLCIYHSLGEVCSHVAALLFKVEAACRLGYNKPSCTSLPCKWNQMFKTKVSMLHPIGVYLYAYEIICTTNFPTQSQVTPAPVVDIEFVKPKHCHKRGQSSSKDPLQPIEPSQKKQIVADSSLHHIQPQICKEELYSSLYKLVPHSALFTIVPKPDQQKLTSSNCQELATSSTTTLQTIADSPPSASSSCCLVAQSINQVISPQHHAANLSPTHSTIQQANSVLTADNTLPLSLTEYFSEKVKGLSDLQVVDKAKKLFQCITLSKHQCELVEMATQCQRQCNEWYRQREGRLTSSSFHEILVRRKQNDASALLKRLLTRKDISSIPAVKWGVDHEDIARKEYISKMAASHQGFQCSLAGLVINPLYPHLGASPDGFTQCHCCGQGLLEIKCPFSGADSHPNDLKQTKGFYLNKQGLSRTHKYFTQIQGQMMICERDFCDFVVWTPKGISTHRIYMDSSFTERLIKTLTTFYVQHFLPELITHYLQCKEARKTPVYCLCQAEEHGKMVQCENPSCKYVWFHFSCVGLKRSPKGSWFCPQCKV